MRNRKIFTTIVLGLHLSTAAQEEPIAAPGEPIAAEEAPPAPAAEIVTEEPTESAEPVATESAAAEPHVIEIPAIPEPVIEDVTAKAEEMVPSSPIGIDTVSLEEPQGNWLFKRIWWERAEERYEKIRNLVTAIWESRTQFFNKRN